MLIEMDDWRLTFI